MQTDNTLAIVIPAYKAKYLDKALDSIAAQTNKNFKLYICDDASEEDIKSIAEKYSEKINITYHRFPDNLGGKNLVEQWNRSVELADTEWIWLFSDDDVLSPGCVQSFFDALETVHNEYNLYRFNIEMIDKHGKVICVKDPHPLLETAYDFMLNRLKSKSLSAAIEYIFRKDIFVKHKGFINFPLAFCADDASWITFAEEKYIYTIPGQKIYWRASDLNISSSRGLHKEKKAAMLKYMGWIKSKYPDLPVIELENWFFEGLKYVYDKSNPLEKYKLAVSLSAILGRSTLHNITKILFNGAL